MDNDLKQDLLNNRPVRVKPLARALNRSANAIYLAINRGEIASSRIGKSVRVPHHEAERLLGMQETSTSKAAA
ncbi:DNA-binding protein [Lichenihabitans psoromatis]|uniref:DNA-binding protein n=1 Tax=Lichenihabitans psoromatis TaxID=2528642 RepID=UPI0010357EA1|nr:DNA-binding protein [Lichenihabitans psoromatis]